MIAWPAAVHVVGIRLADALVCVLDSCAATRFDKMLGAAVKDDDVCLREATLADLGDAANTRIGGELGLRLVSRAPS